MLLSCNYKQRIKVSFTGQPLINWSWEPLFRPFGCSNLVKIEIRIFLKVDRDNHVTCSCTTFYNLLVVNIISFTSCFLFIV